MLAESMFDLSLPWTEYTFVAFDTETSGAYPLNSEIVEFGAVKWKGGQEIATYQTLLKPREKMSDFIIGIHGITNEMVLDAPLMKDKIQEIKDFLSDAIPMAHHAPFDMGFVSVEFEKYGINAPDQPAICTSLLSRKVIPESPNHKLQTLITELNIPRGAAHRALDDAKACLQVGLECMRRMGLLTTLQDILKAQSKNLQWSEYYIQRSGQEILKLMASAVEQKKDIEFIYEAGTLKGKPRRMTPVGLVRNPDGDYVVGICHVDRVQKRFYFNKIKDAQILF